MSSEQVKCQLCGEPMPVGESMFITHGYSGPCPKPPLPREKSRGEICEEACSGIPSSALKPGMVKKIIADMKALMEHATSMEEKIVEEWASCGSTDALAQFRTLLKELEGS